MATELDHNAIKTRIESILEGNSSLYDATGANDKIRQINVGHPDYTNGLENVFPSMYITNANPLERIRVDGSMNSGADDLPPLHHSMRYRIVIQAESKGARKTEELLDDFQKLVLETLEADFQLKNGGSAIVDSSRPEMVELFSNAFNGKPVQGRIITYLCTKVTI